jgi:transcriptional regulator with XRE-family HTH domain
MARVSSPLSVAPSAFHRRAASAIASNRNGAVTRASQPDRPADPAYPGRVMATYGPAGALGEAIRRQRELSHLSMRQFAAMAGISNPYLSQIERGLREPSERVVDAIARSLEMSADALYEEAGINVENDDEAPGTRAAIEADPHLTARQRRALLEVYDGFLAANDRRPGRRRGSTSP